MWRNCKYDLIFLGIHVFIWGTNKVTGWLRNWDSFVIHRYSKSFVVAPCRWSHRTMIILQKMKGDKNKKAIKQIFRCVEGHNYYWLTMFYIINVPKVWQFKLYIHEDKTLTGIDIFISLLLLYCLWRSKLARKNPKLSFNDVSKR